MKTLDKYTAKNFLIGYAIAFCVLLGLRIIIDLFVNLDEFTERADLGTLAVIRNMFLFYALNSTLYFRDFAGMITVLAAVFSLGKMVRCNEFIAMMASGVSLKRVIAPIVFLSVLLTALLVIDQELIIPSLGDKIVRDESDITGQKAYTVEGVTDAKGSLLFARQFDVESSTLHKPTILIRRWVPEWAVWELAGMISADKAKYNPHAQSWELTNGLFIEKGPDHRQQAVDSYPSDISPKDIVIRRKSEYKTLLSWSQLTALQLQGPRVGDLAQLFSQKHFRVTEPIMNVVMLLICLPVLVCRDPKAMKSAVAAGFALTGVCLMTVFISKMLATEAVLNRVELWAWLPIFIFLPTALFELDSMKT